MPHRQSKRWQGENDHHTPTTVPSAAITVGLGQPRLPVMVPWPRIGVAVVAFGVGQRARPHDLAIQVNSHTGRIEGRRMDRTRGNYPHPHARPTMDPGRQPPRPISARENAAVACRAQVGVPRGGAGPFKRVLGRCSGRIYQPGALPRDAVSSVSHRAHQFQALPLDPY